MRDESEKRNTGSWADAGRRKGRNGTLRLCAHHFVLVAESFSSGCLPLILLTCEQCREMLFTLRWLNKSLEDALPQSVQLRNSSSQHILRNAQECFIASASIAKRYRPWNPQMMQVAINTSLQMNLDTEISLGMTMRRCQVNLLVALLTVIFQLRVLALQRPNVTNGPSQLFDALVTSRLYELKSSFGATILPVLIEASPQRESATEYTHINITAYDEKRNQFIQTENTATNLYDWSEPTLFPPPRGTLWYAWSWEDREMDLQNALSRLMAYGFRQSFIRINMLRLRPTVPPSPGLPGLLSNQTYFIFEYDNVASHSIILGLTDRKIYPVPPSISNPSSMLRDVVVKEGYNTEMTHKM